MEHPEHTAFVDLSQGFRTLIDQADLPRVSEHSWWLNISSAGRPYAAGRPLGHRGGLVYLHRFILGPAQDQPVDHVNGNGLDNRRSNLRLCSANDNAANCAFQIGQAGFRGVSASGSRWRAQIAHEGRKRYLGTFETPVDAALAYDDTARKLFGDFAVLNFPAANENSAFERQTVITLDSLRATEFAA